ncbi:MAG: transcriptional regulator NrdR [Thiotrichaceae bacterium]
MHCPFCGDQTTRVVDSRFASDGDQVRRRRECQGCSERFTTYETANFNMPTVLKSNDVRQTFNEHKLRDGMLRALKKRPVSAEQMESAIIRIKKSILSTGESEVQSDHIGAHVMQELRSLDDVAYIRFASVYNSFNTITEFQNIIEQIESSNS